MTKAQHHQTIVNENDSWETPPLILAEVMKKYDITPVLDVCATIQNTKFPKYFTLQDDGLEQEWDEDFFCNPPYSQITAWISKVYEQHKKHNVNALVLVFAKTGVNWWHNFVEDKAEIHFQRGRIRFLLNGIEPRYCTKCKIRFAKEISHCENCGKKYIFHYKMIFKFFEIVFSIAFLSFRGTRNLLLYSPMQIPRSLE